MLRNIKKILLTATVAAPIALAPILLASCEDKPTLEPNLKNATYDAQSKEYKFAGSASAFHSENRKVTNPVDNSDLAYNIYEYERNEDGSYKKDAKGNFIPKKDKNNQEIFNINHIPAKFKNLFSRLFNLSNLKARYSFRIFSFTWDELNKYWPNAANKRRYAIYKNRPDVLFFCIYWIEKENQVTSAFREAVNEVLSKLAEPGVPYSDEEAPWPFHPGLLNDDGYYLKNISDPIPVMFSEL
ncbi:Uncharacterised protein [Metamycoplasma arthritidis]|uniref:Hypothetical lipoprotein n=1 Tax=Metamycoplasma arthritidis (strain 158L3-1) TaxID=243272 RepID=B3PN18_META1|nr:hypothetical protein [Metamycoplasma arthritidis]ACF07420.1 hypothetical lipoprotein [Metamycoplasma arthritidis 158L3-1]VEU78942.1 Uncharacterised protein [Metamycoplasma arthritidis]